MSRRTKQIDFSGQTTEVELFGEREVKKDKTLLTKFSKQYADKYKRAVDEYGDDTLYLEGNALRTTTPGTERGPWWRFFRAYE